MARNPTEFDLQKAFTIWFKGEQRQDGTWKTNPAQLPGVVAWHTPNGGTRDVREAVRIKESGGEAGLHDYFFLWGGLRGIEFKAPGKYRCPEAGLSSVQVAMHARLLAAGLVASAAVDSLADARATVINWGLTVNAGGDSIRE